MKYGKLFAATVGLMVLTAVPAYGAQDEEVEAVLALSQMGSKLGTMTDMNLYLDVKADVWLEDEHVGIRQESNLKGTQLKTSEAMVLNCYSRTMLGEGAAAELTEEDSFLTQNSYYGAGNYYLETYGTKYLIPNVTGEGALEQMDPMDIMSLLTSFADTAKEMEDEMGPEFWAHPELWEDAAGSEDISSSEDLVGLSVEKSADQTVISFTMRDSDLEGTAEGISRVIEAGAGGQAEPSMGDLTGTIVVNSEGYLTNLSAAADITFTLLDQPMDARIVIDLGIADPGQPVEIALPNPAEYEVLE